MAYDGEMCRERSARKSIFNRGCGYESKIPISVGEVFNSGTSQ